MGFVTMRSLHDGDVTPLFFFAKTNSKHTVRETIGR